MEMCGRSIRHIESVDRPSELVQQRLWELLDLAVYKNEILNRSNDLQRILTRTQNEGMHSCRKGLLQEIRRFPLLSIPVAAADALN